MSPTHRDDAGSGCAIAALANDVARGSQEARTAYTHHVRGYLIGLSRALAGRPEGADGDAYMTLAAMVGALILARSVNDPTLYDELLSQTARALRRIAGS